MVSLVEKLYKAQAHFKESRGGIHYAEMNGIPIAKVCTSCDEFKRLKDFSSRDLGGVLHRKNHCRECVREYKKSLGREYLNEQARKYRKNNPEKYLINFHKRRARLSLLPDDFSLKDMESTLMAFRNGCALTGSADFHWDHVIPIATGCGGTTFGNMIPLRSDLNISKNDRNIFDWFEGNYVRLGISREKFDHAIDWLANINDMTVPEYRDYVYSCFEKGGDSLI